MVVAEPVTLVALLWCASGFCLWVPALEWGGCSGHKTKALMKNELTVAQETELLTHMDVITAGIHTFIEVGNALAAIRDGRLYRRTHGTFREFVEENWNMSKSRAYQLIAGAEAAESVSTVVDVPNEAVARDFGRVPKEDRLRVARAAQDEAEKRGATAPNTNDMRKALGKSPKKKAPITIDVPAELPPIPVPVVLTPEVAVQSGLVAVGPFIRAWEDWWASRTNPYGSKEALGRHGHEVAEQVRVLIKKHLVG